MIKTINIIDKYEYNFKDFKFCEENQIFFVIRLIFLLIFS